VTGVRRYRAPPELATVAIGRRVRMPIYFEAELFDQLRLRAEREGSSVSDFVCATVRRRLGG
jgi:hypothetical protein